MFKSRLCQRSGYPCIPSRCSQPGQLSEQRLLSIPSCMPTPMFRNKRTGIRLLATLRLAWDAQLLNNNNSIVFSTTNPGSWRTLDFSRWDCFVFVIFLRVLAAPWSDRQTTKSHHSWHFNSSILLFTRNVRLINKSTLLIACFQQCFCFEDECLIKKSWG